MNVTVDPTAARATPSCWDICPEVFELDDEGHGRALVSEVPVELRERAREAADNCPERAITFD